MKFRRLWDFLHSRHGNIAIITALSAPVLVGFCGLGGETGYLYFRQRDLQGAADIAAYDGAIALESSNALSAITDASTAGASSNGWNSGQGTIAVHNPPLSGSNQNNKSVEVLLSENEPRFFTALFSSGTVPVSVRAVAKYDPTTSACMLGLSKTKQNAVQFWGNANATFQGCNIVSDSSASNAFSVGGSAQVSAPCADTVGGASVNAGLTLTSCGSVKNNIPYVPDPFANVPAPPVGSCGTSSGPGTYCGGLSLSGTQTLSAGIYVVNGGTLKINANANISGSGVTFYLTNGATLSINGNATVDLSAPTSGTYSGLLFYGDRSQADAINTVNGNASSLLTGTIYFPSQEVEFLGNFSGAGGCTQVVADTILYTGSSHFSTNCTGSGVPSIPVSGSVALVE
jgi:Flp pilus assembly protein TadG